MKKSFREKENDTSQNSDLYKDSKSVRKGIKIKFLIYLFLISLIDSCFFQNNNRNNTVNDYSIWISEMNDSNVLRDVRKK